MRKLVSAIAILTAASAFAWPWGESRDYGASRHAPPPPPPPYHHDYHGSDAGWGRDYGEPRHHGGRDWRDDRGGHGHGRGNSKMRLIGEFSPPGGGLEVQLGGGCSHAYVEVSSGTVSFNTIVLRRGAQKQSVTVSARLDRGQRYDIPIDPAVTGLRISCSGKGRFKVYAK